jgi:hypothetical protein
VKIRFSLRLLILLLTAVGLALGFIQSWRLYVSREILALKKEGVVFSTSTNWLGVPHSVDMSCYDNPRCAELHRRLVALGFDDKSIGMFEYR